MSTIPLIYKKIADVMRDLEAIGKDRKNTVQNYAFRGIDDVYNALHPIMAKHGVFSVPTVLDDRTEERTTKSGSALIYRLLKIKFDFFAEDGSSFPAVVLGEGMDSGDKASNKAMAVGHKYALLQVFSIPTQELKDPENESPEVVPKGQPLGKPQGQLISDKTVPKLPGHAVDQMPFGMQEEIYTGLPHQKEILRRDAKKLGITENVSLHHISMTCIHNGVFVDNLPNAIKEWMSASSQVTKSEQEKI